MQDIYSNNTVYFICVGVQISAELRVMVFEKEKFSNDQQFVS